MHKAFWESLESQLNDDPPVYEHAIKLVKEIKEVRPAKQYGQRDQWKVHAIKEILLSLTL